MSETMLVDAVLYWYVPLIFGLYGLTGLRINKTIDADNNNALQHLFHGGDRIIITLALSITVLGGIIGVILFFIPLIIFNAKSSNFDIYVAAFGTIIWLIFLYTFFILLWPSL